MPSCKNVTQIISQSHDRTLTLREHIAIKLHLFICYPCRRFVRQLTILTTVLQRLLKEDIPSDDSALASAARQRIRERLQDAPGKPDIT